MTKEWKLKTAADIIVINPKKCLDCPGRKRWANQYDTGMRCTIFGRWLYANRLYLRFCKETELTRFILEAL